MNKLLALRNSLLAAVPALKQNPEKLLTFVDGGEIHAAQGAVSHSNKYTAQIIITDWCESLEELTVPLLCWLQRNETDHNPSTPRIRYEADIINNSSADISLTVELSDSVKVSDDGTVHVCSEVIPEREFNGTNPLDEWNKANGQ